MAGPRPQPQAKAPIVKRPSAEGKDEAVTGGQVLDLEPTDADGAGGAPPAPVGKMDWPAQALIGIWIIALAAVALGHLPWAWALAERLGNSKSAPRARWLGVAFTPRDSSVLLLIVMLTAVIGSTATLGLTFAHRSGYGTLEKGWGWWYVMRPFTATSVGVLAFSLIQAGFLGTKSAASSGVFAAASIGGLAGLFTDQLLQKMRSALGLGAFAKSAADPAEVKKTNAVDSAP
jgi:hypothetical protein